MNLLSAILSGRRGRCHRRPRRACSRTAWRSASRPGSAWRRRRSSGSSGCAPTPTPSTCACRLAPASRAGRVGASPRTRRRPHADRWLLAAAALFGVALADHRLVALLVPGIGLFVLAGGSGDPAPPAIHPWRRAPWHSGVAALLYLELPLRAGPFRAPLVYGHPETFIGFWYVVLGAQFGGTIAAPLADLGGKVGGLVAFAGDQLGPLGLLVRDRRPGHGRPATALRAPDDAGRALTWLFAASYENADIARYYPARRSSPGRGSPSRPTPSSVVLAGEADDGISTAGRAHPVDARRRGPLLAVAAAAALLVPTHRAPGPLGRPSTPAATPPAEAGSTRPWRPCRRTPSSCRGGATPRPLWYAQLVEGRRPDLWVVDDRTRLDEDLGDVSDVIDANLGARPVYVIRSTSASCAALGRYRLTPVSLPAGRACSG